MALVVHFPDPVGGTAAPAQRKAPARRASSPARPRAAASHLRVVPAPAPAARLSPSTYRRRRVVVGLVAVLGFGAGALVASAAVRWWVTDPVAQAGTPAVGATVARPVAAGDTLWSLALDLRPETDPRVTVDQLARLNGGAELRAGTSVLVPAEWLAGAE